MSLTKLQIQAIRIVPRVMAGMSVLGSSSILFSSSRDMGLFDNKYCCCCCCCGTNDNINIENYNNSNNNDNNNNDGNGLLNCCRRCIKRQQQKQQIRRDRRRYHTVLGRSLLLGMSLADLLSSFSYVIGDIAFPEEKGGLGNQATCNFQGFICNLQVAAALYSGFLAWYYCLYIRYHWRQQQIKKIYEPIAHLCSWLFVLATGITSIVKGLFNPHWIRCYIAGPNSNIYFWTLFYVPIWTSMLFGVIAMLLIYLSVRKTEVKSFSHTFRRQSTRANFQDSSNFSSEQQVDSVASSADRQQQQQQQIPPHLQQQPSLSELPKTRRVAFQGLCYTAAFLFIYVFPTTSRTYSTITNTPPPYAIRLIAVSSVPSQGLMNGLVYYVQPLLHRWWAKKMKQRRRRRLQQQLEQQQLRSGSPSSGLTHDPSHNNSNRLSISKSSSTIYLIEEGRENEEEKKDDQQEPQEQAKNNEEDNKDCVVAEITTGISGGHNSEINNSTDLQ